MSQLVAQRGWVLLIGMLAALGQACTHAGHGQDLRRASHLAQRIDIPEVPFFAQDTDQCGPAALAMALGWTGSDVAPDALRNDVYTPGRHGSLQSGLISAARRRGRLAVPFNGPQALLQELAAGHPVIVLQNLGTHSYPAWHYAVVVGIDRPAERILLHTGLDARRPLEWSRFLHTWERGGYWGLVVLPPGRLPASASESTYLQAVVGLEEARRWAAAESAYTAALERWPASQGARIGLSNCHVMQGDLAAAESVLREAVAQAPDDSDAANNLAHVLARRGRLAEARCWARRAVQSNGPNSPFYRQTLEEIESLLRQGDGPDR